MPKSWSVLMLSSQPVVNPMLGPSGSALINAGARYPPCMKDVVGLPLSTPFPCAYFLVSGKENPNYNIPRQVLTTQPIRQTASALWKTSAALVASMGRSQTSGSGTSCTSQTCLTADVVQIHHTDLFARRYHPLLSQHVGPVDRIRRGMYLRASYGQA